jgi:hypothetical protein
VNLEVVSEVNQIDCHNNNNGSINIAVDGMSGPYNYSWNNGSQSQQIQGLSAGNYVVTITDNLGCDTTFNFTIINPLPLQIQLLTVEDVSCFGLNDAKLPLPHKEAFLH